MATWEQFQGHAWDEEIAGAEEGARHKQDDWALIAQFGATCRKAKTTKHKYVRCLYEFSDFLDLSIRDDNRLVSAERVDVVNFMMWLEGNGEGLPFHLRGTGEATRRPLSASSCKGFLSALRAFYYFALEMRYVDRDPTALVRPPRAEQHKKGMTLEAEEIQRFLDASGGERDRVQAYLVVFTAARAGELCNLRWQDVNIRQRELTLYGKGGKVNVLAVHDELLGALSRWKHVVHEQAQTNPLIASALYDEETRYVLLTRNGRPLTVQTLGKQGVLRGAGYDRTSRTTCTTRTRAWCTRTPSIALGPRCNGGGVSLSKTSRTFSTTPRLTRPGSTTRSQPPSRSVAPSRASRSNALAARSRSG